MQADIRISLPQQRRGNKSSVCKTGLEEIYEAASPVSVVGSVS
jgi:hypothetical protein